MNGRGSAAVAGFRRGRADCRAGAPSQRLRRGSRSRAAASPARAREGPAGRRAAHCRLWAAPAPARAACSRMARRDCNATAARETARLRECFGRRAGSRGPRRSACSSLEKASVALRRRARDSGRSRGALVETARPRHASPSREHDCFAISVPGKRPRAATRNAAAARSSSRARS